MPRRRAPISGIYKIENQTNGKTYVGSSLDIGKRFCEHRAALRRGGHRCAGLQKAWTLYGEDMFAFIIVERCEPSERISREQTWLDITRSADSRFGYNSAPVAQSCLGTKRTDEQKAAARLRGLGRHVSTETRARISAANLRRDSAAAFVSSTRNAKLSVDDVEFIKRVRASGTSSLRLAEMFNVDRSTITRALAGSTQLRRASPA